MNIKPHITVITILSQILVSASIGSAEGSQKMIPAGERFVEFTLQAHDGTTVSSTDLHGRPFLLFFYPKASTPG